MDIALCLSFPFPSWLSNICQIQPLGRGALLRRPHNNEAIRRQIRCKSHLWGLLCASVDLSKHFIMEKKHKWKQLFSLCNQDSMLSGGNAGPQSQWSAYRRTHLAFLLELCEHAFLPHPCHVLPCSMRGFLPDKKLKLALMDTENQIYIFVPQKWSNYFAFQ